MDDKVKDKIDQILIDHLSVSRDEIKTDAKIMDDLGADSLDCIEVTMAIEEEFNIEIDDDEAAELKTVQQIYDYMEKKLTP